MKPVQTSECNSASIYDSYLVRLWQENPRAPFRASATSVQEGQTVYFATLQALFTFLQARTSPARKAK